jgi:hypothetical protein
LRTLRTRAIYGALVSADRTYTTWPVRTRARRSSLRAFSRASYATIHRDASSALIFLIDSFFSCRRDVQKNDQKARKKEKRGGDPNTKKKKLKKRKEQKNKRTKEQTNKRTNEQKNKRTKEQKNKRTNERICSSKKFFFDWLGMKVINRFPGADGLSRDEREIHSNRLTSDRSCSYDGLYDRARKCGASHAQAVLYADKIICARSKSFEADWNPDQQIALYHEICMRLERIESACFR